MAAFRAAALLQALQAVFDEFNCPLRSAVGSSGGRSTRKGSQWRRGVVRDGATVGPPTAEAAEQLQNMAVRPCSPTCTASCEAPLVWNSG